MKQFSCHQKMFVLPVYFEFFQKNAGEFKEICKRGVHSLVITLQEPQVCYRDFHFTFMILCVDKLWIATFHEGKKPFQWEDCLFSFPQKAGLDRHKSVNEGNKPFQYRISLSNFKEEKSFRKHDCKNWKNLTGCRRLMNRQTWRLKQLCRCVMD